MPTRRTELMNAIAVLLRCDFEAIRQLDHVPIEQLERLHDLIKKVCPKAGE